MTFYVKLKAKAEDKRFKFLDTQDGVTHKKGLAMAFPDRATALSCARRLLEQRKGCMAHVTNAKGRARPLTVTESHPGTAQVAAATGLPADVVLALAGVPGCPVVRGGRGRRFASVEAFKGFLQGLTPEQRLKVPTYAAAMRLELAQEIVKLCWSGDPHALARKHTYPELQHMLKQWQDHVAAENADERRRIESTFA